ncbi:MAG: TRAP transporter large permease subunit [Hyphomicrobium sp.]|uniref:TRAP transporter large permease n=1 Tax=Hyphomicrobium sp. CS1BSMeth3 TaxID=1892844 RepID=UPI00086A164E|nr:TRAP transporter large permease subunit [Hyphomicrobium sp. CS1BSMeth3]MBN9277594.1 TRAP transporter large permease subunit [Hyphomicrobium sp.]ODT30240.1 MAG: TRAP dicarboxylate transporter subunit DctM [Hyphomicrobium sp. SCN 65-11]
MSIEVITILLFGSFLLLMAAGLPLVFSLGSAAIIGTYFLWGPEALYALGIKTFSTATSFVLLAIPMFIFMGSMLERSGLATDLYDMMKKWFGGINGGLAVGTILVCTIFAALVGVSGAATVTMGLVALPSMLAARYSKGLSIGCIAGGGALGVLIPPSVLMIVLGLYANVSVGMLFLGGITAGLVIVVLFIVYILVACAIWPEMGPALPVAERATWPEKIAALKAVILPIMLVALVLGSIVGGVATPSEAAGIGAAGSILCALAYGKLTWTALKESSLITLRLTSMVMWIVFAASMFTALYAAVGADQLVRDALSYVPGGKWGTILGMQIIWIIMGCFLDPIGIMLLTVPLFFPIIVQLGFDPVWFGVLFVVNMEMAFLTPPFGFNLFYMRSVAPKGVSMLDIYKAVIPFIALQFLALVLMMIFPELITWLPYKMLR